MDRLAHDLRFAFRYLRRSPLYATTMLATLALGIGMNTAAFGVLYGVRLGRLEAETPRSYVLTERGDAGRHAGSAVTAGFFDLLGRGRYRVGRSARVRTSRAPNRRSC